MIPAGDKGPRGFVRDLRLRWALEEAGLSYSVRRTPFDERTTAWGRQDVLRSKRTLSGISDTRVGQQPNAVEFASMEPAERCRGRQAGGIMEIINLPAGEQASDESDCVRIQELADGGFSLEGSVLLRCGDAEIAESVSLIGGEAYDAAEAAGLAWANEHCAEILYVCRSDGIKPLPNIA